MKVSELMKTANFNLLNKLYEKDIDGVFISDMVSDIVAGTHAGNLLLTIQTHKSLIASANLVDVSAIVYVRNKKPQDDVVELADRANISLFTTEEDAWKLAIKLHEIGLK